VNNIITVETSEALMLYTIAAWKWYLR